MGSPHTLNACRTHSAPLLLLPLLVLLAMASYSLAIEVTLANDTASTVPTVTSTSTSSTTTLASGADKIARRIAEERSASGAGIRGVVVQQEPLWKRNKLQASSGTPVTELIDESVEKRDMSKRTVGPSQEPIEISSNGDSGAKLREANNGSVIGDKEQQPAARFHGNKLDDRYNVHGWRSSSYLNYGKDKGYYDQRAHYPYDRYNGQRPSANYAAETERFGNAPARPNTNVALDGDRYGSTVPAIRPSNYQSANYGYGDNRPRPGIANYYGAVNANVNGDGDGGDYPAGDPSQHSAYLQTQKAVALKALAGVALIGAAAALASNPVLLPISVISAAAAGRRRKRSTDSAYKEDESTSGSGNYALAALLQGYIQPAHPNEVSSEQQSTSSDSSRSSELDDLNLDRASDSKNKVSKPPTPGVSRQELVISPRCVARLACHVHRDYLDELERSRARAFLQLERDDSSNATKALSGLESFFDSLVHSNILGADYLSDELKSLIQSAVAVGSNRNASCDEFSCLDISESLVINKT